MLATAEQLAAAPVLLDRSALESLGERIEISGFRADRVGAGSLLNHEGRGRRRPVLIDTSGLGERRQQ
jgi:hypothetical protein